jgi:3',5'-cyclic AMP phosphodiesterase CpdA
MKKVLAFFCSLLLCAGLCLSLGAEALNFKDGKFEILILADPQDTDRPQQAMLDLLNASLDAAKPDLVVFLGDMIHSLSIGDNPEATKAAIDAIIKPVVDRGLQFAVVFGNHDDEGGISKEAQMAYYQSFPGCLAVEGEPMTGCGNYYLTVNSADGTSKCVLWFFDSGTYDTTGAGTYACVEKDQLDWYKQTSAQLTSQYGKQLPGFAFQHIIVPEVYDMLSVVPKGTKGAVRGIDAWQLKYYPQPR